MAIGTKDKPHAKSIQTITFEVDVPGMIHSLADTPQPIRTVMQIGREGTWKTLQLRTIPPELRTLLVDFDGRSSVLNTFDLKHIDICDKIRYIPPIGNSEQDLGSILEMEAHLRALIQELTHGSLKDIYDLIILDTITPLNELLWDLSFIKLGNQSASHKIGFGDDTEENFGWFQKELKQIIWGFAATTPRIIVNAHIKEVSDYADKNAPKDIRLDSKGKIREFLPRMFQEVYYTVKRGKEYQWLTSEYQQMHGRTTLPLPQFVPMDWSIPFADGWKQFVTPGLTQEKAKDE